MSAKLCYRDLAHPTFQETLTGHNYTTLKLVKTGKKTCPLLAYQIL